MAGLPRAFFKVIAVDLPGHGGTDHLPRGCEYMAGSGLVLNSVLDTLGVDYVGIIAHSMGARIACEMASRTPNRVVVLILVDSVTGAAWDRRMRNVRRLPLLFAPLAAEFLQDFGVCWPGSADRPLGGPDSTGLRHLHRARAASDAQLRPGHPVADQCPAQRAAARRDRPGGLPTVVMWGDQDRLVSRACAEGTAETTNARLIVVKDSGHSWPLQNRDTAKHILVESLADELAPDSLGILLSKAVTRHGRVNPRIATQATLEASPLYSHNSLAQALTPPAAFWEKGVPSSEPRVSWTHQLMPRPAVA